MSAEPREFVVAVVAADGSTTPRHWRVHTGTPVQALREAAAETGGWAVPPARLLADVHDSLVLGPGCETAEQIGQAVHDKLTQIARPTPADGCERFTRMVAALDAESGDYEDTLRSLIGVARGTLAARLPV